MGNSRQCGDGADRQCHRSVVASRHSETGDRGADDRGGAYKEEEKYAYNIFTVKGFYSPVSKEETQEEATSIIRPYDDKTVEIGKSFYDYKAETENQEDSIIYYEIDGKAVLSIPIKNSRNFFK